MIAGLMVKSLDLTTVRWLVIVVVIYAAVTMMVSAFSSSDVPDEKGAGGVRS